MRIKWCKAHHSEGQLYAFVEFLFPPYCGDISKIRMEYCKVDCS